MGEPAITFGSFRLVGARRLLLDGDKPVRLGGRAFDILEMDCFDQAAAMAREQGALAWGPRIGLSACRLRVAHGRGDVGRRELASIYGRFTEGFDTADLIAARQLLDAPGNAGPD